MGEKTLRLTLVAEGTLFGEGVFKSTLEFIEDGVVVKSSEAPEKRTEGGILEATLLAGEFAETYSINTVMRMARKAGNDADIEELRGLAAVRGVVINE